MIKQIDVEKLIEQLIWVVTALKLPPPKNEPLVWAIINLKLHKALEQEYQKNASKAKQDRLIGYVGGIALVEEAKDLRGTYYPRGIGDKIVEQILENPKRQIIYYNHDKSRPVGKILRIWVEEVAEKRYVMVIAAVCNEGTREDIENRKLTGFSLAFQAQKIKETVANRI